MSANIWHWFDLRSVCNTGVYFVGDWETREVSFRMETFFPTMFEMVLFPKKISTRAAL